MSFTAQHLFFRRHRHRAGMGVACRTVTEADIVNFAGMSGDFNPIHVDHEFAAPRCSADPSRTGCWFYPSPAAWPCIRRRCVRSPSCRSASGTFAGPVFPGDTIGVRTKVLEKEVRGRGRHGSVVWQRQVMNQEKKVVQEGVTVTLVETARPARPRRRSSQPDRSGVIP